MKIMPKGFSLIELMITLAIIGIAASIAVPSAQSFLNNQKMKSATFDVVTTVMQARSEAMKWGAPSSGVPSISIVKSSSTGGMSDGWCVTFTSSSTCNVLLDAGPGPDVMLVGKATAKVTYSTLANPIVFGHTGRLLTGTGMASPPVRILVTDNDSYASARCVVVDSNGNAKTYLQSGGTTADPRFTFGASTNQVCA